MKTGFTHNFDASFSNTTIFSNHAPLTTFYPPHRTGKFKIFLVVVIRFVLPVGVVVLSIVLIAVRFSKIEIYHIFF